MLKPSNFIDFRIGQPDRRCLPAQALLETAQETLRGPYGRGSNYNDPSRFIQYGSEDGGSCVGVLCDFLNRFDHSRKVRLDSNTGLMLSAGNSHAIDLICSALSAPNDTILVESPTYFLAHQIFKDHKLNIVEANFSKKGEVEMAIDTHSPSLAYCVPTYQNPGASTISESRRTEIVELIHRHNMTLISDEAYQLLHFESASPPPPPFAEIDQHARQSKTRMQEARQGRVFSCGSFSKIAGPGFRLGWIEGDADAVNQLADRGYLNSGGGISSSLSSSLIEDMLRSGKLEEIIVGYRKLYGERAVALIEGISKYCPGVKIHGTGGSGGIEGGYFLWCELPMSSIDNVTVFMKYCEEHYRLSFLPGDTCFHARERCEHGMVRLCFAMYNCEELLEGARRLGAAIESYPAIPSEVELKAIDY